MAHTPFEPAAPRPLPAAVLWDLDGTLIDSEPYWMQAEGDLVHEHGGRWTYEDGLDLVGNPLLTSAEVLQAAGVEMEPEAIVDHLVFRVVDQLRRQVPWRPGALDLLAQLRRHAIPCAVVTMSYRVLAETVTRAAPAGSFATVVAGDEVSRGKPDPESYLLAAAHLGVEPTWCVAIEDSPTGIASAMASGAVTLGIPSVVPIDPVRGLSRAGSLAEIGLSELATMVAGTPIDLLASRRD